jgi:hypothetical protein
MWCDMRSKDINQGAPSFHSTNVDDVKTVDIAVQVYPNPFEKGFSITVILFFGLFNTGYKSGI